MLSSKEMPAFAGYSVCCHLCNTFKDGRGRRWPASTLYQNQQVLLCPVMRKLDTTLINLPSSVLDNAIINPLLFFVQYVLSPLPGKPKVSEALLKDISTYVVASTTYVLPIFLWSSTPHVWESSNAKEISIFLKSPGRKPKTHQRCKHSQFLCSFSLITVANFWKKWPNAVPSLWQ